MIDLQGYYEQLKACKSVDDLRETYTLIAYELKDSPHALASVTEFWNELKLENKITLICWADYDGEIDTLEDTIEHLTDVGYTVTSVCEVGSGIEAKQYINAIDYGMLVFLDFSEATISQYCKDVKPCVPVGVILNSEESFDIEWIERGD